MGDGREYTYYAPSATTMRRLGIQDIEGDQNKNYLDGMRTLYSKHKFEEFAIAMDPNPAVEAALEARENETRIAPIERKTSLK